MRVLVITNLYPNPCQPQRATFNRQHFRALASDHEVKVVAPIAWTDELKARWKERDAFWHNRRWTLDGVEVFYPRYYYPPGVLRSRYGRYFLASIRSAVHAVGMSFQPDILLGSWAYPDGYAAVRLAGEMRIPAAVQVLGSDLNLLERYPSRSRETWNTLYSADAVIAVSKHLAKKVVDHGVESHCVSVVYGGVDRATFFPGPQRDAQAELGIRDANPMLLFVGNLVPVKAVDVLVAACSRLVHDFPNLQCHVIGDGPLRAKLQHLATSLSLHKRLRFHGVVEHGQLPTWYRACDLVVLPSLSEGVPNVLLESIACGRPYVATSVGGIPEISSHPGCLLVAPGDPQRLADAITSKLRDRTAPTPTELPVSSWHEAGRALGGALENCLSRARTLD